MSEGSAPPMPTISAPQQPSVQIDKEQQERIAAYLSTRRHFVRFWNSALVFFIFFVIIPWAYSVIAAIFWKSRTCCTTSSQLVPFEDDSHLFLCCWSTLCCPFSFSIYLWLSTPEYL